MRLLEIKNLYVKTQDGNEILKGVNLKIEKRKVYVLMGPNGSGKSTLANVLMGHSKYKITQGDILLKGKSILDLSTDDRAKRGVFLSFQYPKEISGITMSNFLRTAYNSINEDSKLSLLEFQKYLKEKADELKIDGAFLTRYLNEGFSGGEKKKGEILQMKVLNPDLAVLDETDSGLDIDSLRFVAEGINDFMSEEKTILIITHYKRMLDYIKTDKIFIMKSGKIVKEGGREIIDKLEKEGYENF